MHAGVPPAPPSLTFTTTSLDRATVSWAKAATATRYRVELKQTGTGNSAVVSTAAVDGSGDGPFSQTFDNLTPGSYAVSVHCEWLWVAGVGQAWLSRVAATA